MDAKHIGYAAFAKAIRNSRRRKFEKAIGGPATWRNVNTIVRLAAKYSH